MKSKVLSLSLYVVSIFTLLAVSVGTVVAHVVVSPSETVTGKYEQFSVSVPNEKEIATTSIKLEIPATVESVTPEQKSPWKIELTSTGEGETKKITAITWSGSTIEPEFYDSFSFKAKMPAEATELQWKAYQTYADGTVVAWDQAEEGENHNEESHDGGPFSVTRVVNELDNASANIEETNDTTKNTADWALYTAIAGVVLALIAVFMASRTRNN